MCPAETGAGCRVRLRFRARKHRENWRSCSALGLGLVLKPAVRSPVPRRVLLVSERPASIPSGRHPSIPRCNLLLPRQSPGYAQAHVN